MNDCPPIIGCPDWQGIASSLFDFAVLAIANWYYSLPLLAVVVIWVVAVGVAYRQGGLPAALGVAMLFGFLLGRRQSEPDAHEHVSGNDAVPSRPVRKPRKPFEPPKSLRGG